MPKKNSTRPLENVTAQASRRLRAAIYLRVSSVGQEDKFSLPTQDAACRKWKDDHDYTLDEAHVYRDVHTGIELWERPDLTRLREDMRAHAWDVLIFYALDRLSREDHHIGLLATEAEHVGVRFECVTEVFDETPTGRLIMAARGFAAKVEHEKIRERIMRGRRARVQAGHIPACHQPRYGHQFTPDKTGYLPDPDTADVVRRIFDLALGGTAIRRIGIILDADGVPTPKGGKFWRPGVIHNILADPIYIGRPTMMGVALPEGTVPALVDEETFAAVAVQLQRNKVESSRNNQHPELTLLRGGYVRCSGCGCSMFARPKKKIRQYVCPQSMVGCTAPASIKAETLDAAVWDRLYEIATHPEAIAERIAYLKEHDSTEADLATVDRALTELARRHQRGARALLDVDDDSAAILKAELATIAKRRHALQEERARVLGRHQEWEAAQQQLREIERWCAVAAENMQDAPYERKRQALGVFNVQVTVYRADHSPRYEIVADPSIASSSIHPAGRNIRLLLRWTDADALAVQAPDLAAPA